MNKIITKTVIRAKQTAYENDIHLGVQTVIFNRGYHVYVDKYEIMVFPTTINLHHQEQQLVQDIVAFVARNYKKSPSLRGRIRAHKFISTDVT